MTTATPSTALATIQPAFTHAERLALAGFLAGYRGLTREAYALDLRQFTTWCRVRTVAADLDQPGRRAQARLRDHGRCRRVQRRPDGAGLRRTYEITAVGQEILAEQIVTMQQIVQVARLRTATAWGA